MLAFLNAHILAIVFGLLEAKGIAEKRFATMCSVTIAVVNSIRWIFAFATPALQMPVSDSFGNIISFLVFLAPLPTFYKIYRKKSSEGYQAIPYMVALFSAALLLYYAFLKTNAYMIVCINGIGCVIEAVYLSMYLFYAPKKTKISTIKFISVFNIGGLGTVLVLSLVLVKGPKRVELVGWTCAVINLAVFAAPLSIMNDLGNLLEKNLHNLHFGEAVGDALIATNTNRRQRPIFRPNSKNDPFMQRKVIRTKSVEYMPFMLSFSLTLCATSWFFYGFFVNDYFIAVPNVAGFLFGITQMILYCVYKDCKKQTGSNSVEKPNKIDTDRENHEVEVVVCDGHRQ